MVADLIAAVVRLLFGRAGGIDLNYPKQTFRAAVALFAPGPRFSPVCAFRAAAPCGRRPLQALTAGKNSGLYASIAHASLTNKFPAILFEIESS